MSDTIDPDRATYAFANRFVNGLATLPGGTRVQTAGRCGGMAYSMLDHASAARDVPVWPAALFAPERVPPDGHLVADHLRARQLDSFRSVSALRFLTWSVLPDGDVGAVAGVRTRTRRELPRVLRALAEGRPVVLGLVVARSLLRSGDNHQVVATSFTRDAAGDVVLHVLDPNTPRREVTLVEAPDGWRASNGRLWRGFFRHAYAPRTPPVLPSASRRPTARVRSGAAVALAHVATGRLLVVADRTPVLRASGTTAWTLAVVDPGSSDRASTGPGATGRVVTGRGAEPLADGARVRLVAPGAAASSLALVDGGPALADGPSGTWRVVVDGGGPWHEGSRVRLLHVTTGSLLAGGAGGPTTTFTPDPSTWWTVAAR